MYVSIKQSIIKGSDSNRITVNFNSPQNITSTTMLTTGLILNVPCEITVNSSTDDTHSRVRVYFYDCKAPLARASHVKWRYTKYLGFSFFILLQCGGVMVTVSEV